MEASPDRGFEVDSSSQSRTCMKRHLIIGVLLLTVANAITLAEGGPSSPRRAVWDGKALITAKPVSVRRVEAESSEEANLAEITMTEHFRVSLSNINVVRGEFDKKRIKVVLRATHREVLSRSESIFVLLDLQGEDIKAIYWGLPESFACFPAALIENAPFQGSFWIKDVKSNRLCTNAQWYP